MNAGENIIREYDINGNLTHRKYINGLEEWTEYNKEGKITHFKDSSGYESWAEVNGEKSNGK